MKLRLTKHKLTLEDFTKETFSFIDYGTIEARLLHTQYNDILQYYFIKLLFDAVESSRSACNCKSRLTDKFVLEQCDTQCEQIPNKDLFNKYIEDNLETYLNFVYKKFDEWLEFKRHNCNNDCETYIPLDFADLKYPIMDCLHDNSVISDFLEFNDIDSLQDHILKITDYLDFKLDTDPDDTDIESLKYFEYIKQFNQLNNAQWPDKVYLKGYRNYYDGAEGEFYLQETKVAQDYGIVNNFKGLCYKRYYSDSVDAKWFGVDYFEDHTKIFLYLLSYNKVNLGALTYNIEMTAVAQRPVNSNIWWYGQNAKVSIKILNEQDAVLQFILLQDIYEIKIEGLSINVSSEHTIPNFISMNDDFKVDIFLFDSTLQSTLGVDTNEYLLEDTESIKSDIFWSTLPLLPTVTNTDNELQFLNLGYINMVKETTVDSVLTLDTVQNVEVVYNLENSFKLSTESQYGNNKQPLLKKYLNDTYFHSIAEKYIDKQKTTIVNQMDMTLPDGFVLANTVDNGFINENIKSSENWDVAGSGDVSQDFHRLLHLPNYLDNLEFLKNINIFGISKYLTNFEKPIRKMLPTRWFKYDSNNDTECSPSISNDDNYPLYMPMSHNKNYNLTRKTFKITDNYYYEIKMTCNQDWGNCNDVNSWFYMVYFSVNDISPLAIVAQLLGAPATTYTRQMQGWKYRLTSPYDFYNTGGSINYKFDLGNIVQLDKVGHIWTDEYIDFEALWGKYKYTVGVSPQQFFTKTTISGTNVYEAYTIGRTKTFYTKAPLKIEITYMDN